MSHWLRRRYAIVFGTVKRARAAINFALALFTTGAALGVSLALLRPDRVTALAHSLAASLGSDSPLYPKRAWDILLHNSLADYACLWLGRFRGVVPALSLIGNGALLGAVITLAVGRLSTLDLVLGIVPHGVFELPANLLAGGLGLWLGASAGARQPLGPTHRRRRRSDLVFLLLVLPLLAVAAAIEGW